MVERKKKKEEAERNLPVVSVNFLYGARRPASARDTHATLCIMQNVIKNVKKLQILRVLIII